MRGNIVSKTIYNEALECNLKLICLGNKKLEDKLRKSIKEKEGEIILYDKENNVVTQKRPGLTNLLINKEKLLKNEENYIESFNVYLYDPKNYDINSIKRKLHNSSHESFHVFSAIIPPIIKDNSSNFISNNIVYYNAMGCVGAFTNTGIVRYGKMIKETLTDILTTLSLTQFNDYFYNNKITPNRILKEKFDQTEYMSTGYSSFTAITKLLIAAFSNNPNDDYDAMLLNNKNIFFSNRNLNNGEKLFDNDLLFGYIACPIHIKDKWEEIKGINSYDEFCNKIDNAFDNYLKTSKIDGSAIENTINEINDFFNKKIIMYVKRGRFTSDEANDLVDNYNAVLREIQEEYRPVSNNIRKDIEIPVYLYDMKKANKNLEYV